MDWDTVVPPSPVRWGNLRCGTHQAGHGRATDSQQPADQCVQRVPRAAEAMGEVRLSTCERAIKVGIGSEERGGEGRGAFLHMTAIAKGPLALSANRRSMRVACGAQHALVLLNV